MRWQRVCWVRTHEHHIPHRLRSATSLLKWTNTWLITVFCLTLLPSKQYSTLPYLRNIHICQLLETENVVIATLPENHVMFAFVVESFIHKTPHNHCITPTNACASSTHHSLRTYCCTILSGFPGKPQPKHMICNLNKHKFTGPKSMTEKLMHKIRCLNVRSCSNALS